MKKLVAVLLLLGLAGCSSAPSKEQQEAGFIPLLEVTPVYPAAAFKRHVQGCVMVSFDIDAAGLADHYEVLESKPKGVFDRATLLALNQWRFKPLRGAGRYTQVINYQIQGEASAVPQCFDTLNHGSVAR